MNIPGLPSAWLAVAVKTVLVGSRAVKTVLVISRRLPSLLVVSRRFSSLLIASRCFSSLLIFLKKTVSFPLSDFSSLLVASCHFS